MSTLIAHEVPLHGVRLIEASAGTGKTFTITSLYIRLVLGHDCVALSPEQILVVTFTRAATEELRDRIRKRLKTAYLALLHNDGSDDLISNIQSQLTNKEQALQRLKDAQQLMDLSAIYTIHGFCKRLLQQNAIESGVVDDFEFILDDSQLLTMAVRDVWRNAVYPLEGEQLDLVLENWKQPDELQKALRPFIHKIVDFHVGPKPQALESAANDFHTAFARLQNQWQMHGEDFLNAIAQHPKANGSFTRHLDSRRTKIHQYLAHSRKDDDGVLKYFTSAELIKSVKKGAQAIEHPLSELIEGFIQRRDMYEQAKVHARHEWLITLLKQVRIRLLELKDQQRVLSPDDLLSQLNKALDHDNGPSLLKQIRLQYPVAMVDEFQDTDELQYRIFKQVYQPAENNQDLQPQDGQAKLGLFMIGDPKQAIYKFRGADIFTYIQAKHHVDSAYSLETNYRSSDAMVSAVNSIFTQHDGPFIYDKDIPFQSVAAFGKAHGLELDHVPQAALTWQTFAAQDVGNKNQLKQLCAQGTAEQISLLLNQAQQGSATIASEPLKAKDCAVLVRSANQAILIKEALAKRNIACVYVGKERIFQSEEAIAIYSLMQAIHKQSEAQYRSAIAHPIWEFTLHDLQRFTQQESIWERQLEQLFDAHDIWQKKGIMAMLLQWLNVQDLPRKWLQADNGERRLTNILHLAELLQVAASVMQGMQGLLSWFIQQLNEEQADQDQQQLRLESDANLVQIITMHKSKGLEYPVVFLPFTWDGKASRDEVFYDEQQKKLRCDLVGDFEEQRVQEGLAEEVRLLYVALTRAVSSCYVVLPSMQGNKAFEKSFDASALKHVLFGQQTAKVTEFIAAIANQPASVMQTTASLPSASTRFEAKTTTHALSVRQFNQDIKQDWRMSSFSALVRNLHAPPTARFNQDDEIISVVASEADIPTVFNFPRGAHAGNFLHTLFEDVDFNDSSFSALEYGIDGHIHDLLVRFAIDVKWTDFVKHWLLDMLATPLQHNGLALNQLTQADKLVEMEFYFPVHSLSCEKLNALLAQYPCVDVPVHGLDFYQLKGMLKGFIDLTFCWQGQYYILDYKSNHLGDGVDCYGDINCQQAMAEHRYDVQLLLYTLALHRMLKLRIENYDYDQHIGGGYYLFLRGLNTQNKNGQYFHKPARALIEALDDLITEPVSC